MADYDTDYEPDEYDDREGSQNILGHDGKPRVLASQCSTCIGLPGNLMQLRSGRVRQMIIAACGPSGGGIPCHQTVSYGGHPEFGGPALCRWFYDHYGHQCNLVRIYERLGGFTEVPVPEEDGSEQEAG